jgi:hypothetical protein
MNKTRSILTKALPPVALLLAAAAYWLPWVGHPTAALKLSGQDLGEFVKFVPEIGPSFPRQIFYIPPLFCTLCLVLLAANHETQYPRWLRVGLLACALLLLPGLLPPAWGHPRELFMPEFRLQGLAVVIGALVILGHGLLRLIPGRGLPWTVGALALVALVLPQAAFWTVKGRVWAIYATPSIHLGWGLWLHIAAWMGVLIGVWLTVSAQTAFEEEA